MGRSTRMPILKLTGILLMAGAGCASGLRGSADLLRAGDPTRAAEAAQVRLASHPDDPAALRDLGIALYELSRPSAALDPLERALKTRPRDRDALLFRARSLDALGRGPNAIEAYGAYIAVARGKQAETARARMEQLRRLQIRQDVQRAVAREESLSVAAIPESTLAVPDFANPAGADTLRPLAKGLAAMVVTDLAQVHGLRILERQRIGTLLGELELTRKTVPGSPKKEAPPSIDPAGSVLGQQQRLAQLLDPSTGNPFYRGSIDGLAGPQFTEAVRAFQKAKGLAADGRAGPRTVAAIEDAWQGRPPGAGTVAAEAVPLFDPRYAPRLGRLLGARRIVQGAVLRLGESNLQLRADLLPVVQAGAETTLASPPVEGRFTEVLALQKRLVLEILDVLGIRLTREERRRIEAKQTDDYAAFLDYCRGLDFEDRGMTDEALSHYRLAFARDPGFGMAGQAAAVLSVGASDLQGMEQDAVKGIGGGSAAADAGARASATAAKLDVAPAIEAPREIETVTPEAQREGGTGTIVVSGDIPGAGGGKR